MVTPKPKLILFADELPHCPCYPKILKKQFEVIATSTEAEFIQQLQDSHADVAIICFSSSKEAVTSQLLKMIHHTGPLPVVVCAPALEPDSIREAAYQGTDRFITHEMAEKKIVDVIVDAMRRGGLRKYLQSNIKSPYLYSPHIHKIIVEIVRSFPYRLKESEMAERLGVSRSWIQKLCRQAFGFPYTRLRRRIWVYQGLRLMQNTNLDNTEIALQLNYSEVSNLARDFRKELGLSPTAARKALIAQSPERLLGSS